MEKLRVILDRYMFVVERSSEKDGEIAAARFVAKKGLDKVCLWIERDLNDAQALRIHLQYAHFEPVLGASANMSQIKIDEVEERRAIGMLIAAIAELGEVAIPRNPR